MLLHPVRFSFCSPGLTSYSGRGPRDPSMACEGLHNLSAFLWLWGAWGNLCIFLRNSLLSHFFSSIFCLITGVVTIFLNNNDFLILSCVYGVPLVVFCFRFVISFLWNWAMILDSKVFFFLRFYLFIHERHTERDRDTGRGRSWLPVGNLMWDSIQGPQDHNLSQRHRLNHWATQMPQILKFW